MEVATAYCAKGLVFVFGFLLVRWGHKGKASTLKCELIRRGCPQSPRLAAYLTPPKAASDAKDEEIPRRLEVALISGEEKMTHEKVVK